jgi:hypothetical protein
MVALEPLERVEDGGAVPVSTLYYQVEQPQTGMLIGSVLNISYQLSGCYQLIG